MQILISAIGHDRLGFVHDITETIHRFGGNVEHQRSVRLADEYVVMLLVSLGDRGATDELLDQLRAFTGEDLLVRARVTESNAAELLDATSAEVSASGADQPGILEAVTSLLLKHDINIDGMDFDTESAPMTGDQLFRMDALLSIPKNVDLTELRQQLRCLEDDFNFDILFQQFS